MRTIVNMKPGHAGLHLFEELRAAGADAVYWPAFHFERSKDFEKSKEAIIRKATEGALLILVSPTTVAYMKEIFSLLPAGASFACVGEPTAHVLLKEYPQAGEVQFPHGSSLESGSELLFHQFQQDGCPKKAVIIRGDTGRAFLIDALREEGTEVTVAPIYKRIPLAASREQKDWAGKGPAPVIYLTSSDSVDILLSNIEEKDRPWLLGGCAVTIHPRIGDHLHDAGFNTVRLIESKDPETCRKLIFLARNGWND